MKLDIPATITAIGQFIWKWTLCSWAHRSYHCKPTVWGPEQAKEMGIPYKPNAWHCSLCHPCNEALDKLFTNVADTHDTTNEAIPTPQ